jgi:hypothetical protein
MLHTRNDLALIIASEEVNKLIGCPRYKLLKLKIYNLLMTMSEDDFIKRFERDKKFKLIRVIKNRYFI